MGNVTATLINPYSDKTKYNASFPTGTAPGYLNNYVDNTAVFPGLVHAVTGNMWAYHGLLTHFVAPPGKKSSATIDLIKDTKTINVHIIGVSYLDQLISKGMENRTDFSNFFDIHIASKNGRYIYDNTIDSYAHPLIYKFRQPTVLNDTLKTNTRVLRLMAENDPSELHVSYPGNDSFYSVNMVNEIKKIPQYSDQEDFDREDEFTFEIKIDPSLSVTISINGWVIQSIVPNN